LTTFVSLKDGFIVILYLLFLCFRLRLNFSTPRHDDRAVLGLGQECAAVRTSETRRPRLFHARIKWRRHLDQIGTKQI
jgi:hypothetical protein